MKLRGKVLEEKATLPIVFERPSGPLVLMVSAVLNTSDFDKIYPPPTPPHVIRKGQKVLNTEAPAYVEALAIRNRSYTSWMVINSLSSTEGLEWETVKTDDPNTWSNWENEMKKSGFSDGEIMYIINKMVEVNALSEVRLDEARKSFLLGQVAATSQE